MISRRKAQSTIEYILLVTATIAVVIFFLLGNGNQDGTGNVSFSPFQSRINEAFSASMNGTQTAVNQLFDSLRNYPTNGAAN